MHKFNIIVISIFIFIISISSYSYAEILDYFDWRTGEKIYYNVHNYDELYSAYEDFHYDYERLREEYYSLQHNLEEKNHEIDLLSEEISQLKEDLKGEQIKNYNLTNNEDWKAILIPTVLYFIPLVIYYLYNKFKHKNS